MKKTHLWLLAAIVTFTLLNTSCGNKNVSLSVSKEEMSFTSTGGQEIVRVEADCDWVVEVSENAQWIHVNPLNGSKTGIIAVTVDANKNTEERSSTINVVSENRKVKKMIRVNQEKVEITQIHNKLWFLYFYERWATDYKDDYIEDSYEHWNYYIDESYDNWFMYFMEDNKGYQAHTKNGDTVYYAYDYVYYPLGDSLYINFQVDTNVVEDYHATIRLLTEDRFEFSDEFTPHRFEKLYLANLSDKRGLFNINPAKVMKKEHGPLIQVER